MNTHRNLHPAIVDLDGLYAAYRRARSGHLDSISHLRFQEHLGENLLAVHRRLKAGTWTTGPYSHFIVAEPKRRLIASLPFADRVVQHAIDAVVGPIWMRRFIHDSYACQPGKGTHLGLARVQHMIRSCTDIHGRCFALKADIKGYFAHIDHAEVKRQLRRHIACQPTLALLDEIIDSSDGDVGIPIGNLTSQLLANIYLHDLDMHAKHELRRRWYGRYMDDFVILGADQAELHQIRRHLAGWLRDKLGLELNHKTQVQPVSDRSSERLDFLGYRVGPTVRRVRKATIRRMNRGIAASRNGRLTSSHDAFVASYRGILSHEHPRRRELPVGLTRGAAA